MGDTDETGRHVSTQQNAAVQATSIQHIMSLQETPSTRQILGHEDRFGGKCLCTAEENTGAVLVDMGINWIERKVLGNGVNKEHLIITEMGECIDLQERDWPVDEDMHLKLGEENQVALPHNAGMMTVFTSITDDGKWVSIDETHDLTITRELLQDGRMKQTMETKKKHATVIRWYSKQ